MHSYYCIAEQTVHKHSANSKKHSVVECFLVPADNISVFPFVFDARFVPPSVPHVCMPSVLATQSSKDNGALRNTLCHSGSAVAGTGEHLKQKIRPVGAICHSPRQVCFRGFGKRSEQAG